MSLRDYALVTIGYWGFTLTDGALRMLVLLHFHELGYSPVSIAFLFLLYEVMGVATNLVGGWLGARSGLNRTLLVGLSLQVLALATLATHDPAWPELLSVSFVMGLQALSGVAKDLTKMSSKSAVKFVAGDGTLFRMVAILTGSKNALKGVGFFLGAVLLSVLGYRGALLTLATGLALVLAAVAWLLDADLGRAAAKPSFDSVLSPSAAVNQLSAARLFLFASRDIWFVVALPVFLGDQLGWSFEGVGAFLAAWVIGYGVVQALAPRFAGLGSNGGVDEAALARRWVFTLMVLTGLIAAGALLDGVPRTIALVGGLAVFGVVFAVNSSLHSYLILAYGRDEDVSLDVGFYYSANAAGRLLGTLLSGVLYLIGGLPVAMVGSTLAVAVAWFLSLRLPAVPAARSGPRPAATVADVVAS